MNSTVHTLHRDPKMLPTIRETSEAEIAQEMFGTMLTKMEQLSSAAYERGHLKGFLAGSIVGAVVGIALFTLAAVCVYALHVAGSL